jgi:hypothetical protein
MKIGFDFAKEKKFTISGIIMALVTFIIYIVMVGAFYPMIQNLMDGIVGLDPSFRLMVNFGILLIGIGILVSIILDATAGRREEYGGV